ncbi:MAG: GGDEF domain-containing protein [Polyangiales bacterium]
MTPDRRTDRPFSASNQAGLVRIAFAIAAALFAESVCPHDRSIWYASLAYVVVAIVFQVAIRTGFARGEPRSVLMGFVDIAFLTFPVYQLGPATSVLPFGYLLIPVINAASSASRAVVALMLASIGSLAYVALLTATGLGALPYAPGVAGVSHAAPGLAPLLASGTLVVMSVVLTTMIVLRQLDALDQVNQQLEALSQRDELTNLSNRRQLFGELRHQLERVARGARCGAVMIDLDGFKQVNDRLGHDVGDLVLQDIAAALTSETRSVDLVARYGGDEFVVVLPDLAPERARTVAERVVMAIARAGTLRCPGAPVTGSVGVAVACADDDVSSLLRRADTLAYAAKRAGGNRVAMANEVSPMTPPLTAGADARGATVS